MKLKKIAGSILVAACSIIGVAHAAGSYFPPERISCEFNQNGGLHCDGFNHAYLTEDTYTSHLRGRTGVFNFSTGSAYFVPSMHQATIFFTYKNPELKTVKLKSTTDTIRPDLKRGSWRKVADDLYVCDAGYMRCPITNLPA